MADYGVCFFNAGYICLVGCLGLSEIYYDFGGNFALRLKLDMLWPARKTQVWHTNVKGGWLTRNAATNWGNAKGRALVRVVRMTLSLYTFLSKYWGSVDRLLELSPPGGQHRVGAGAGSSMLVLDLKYRIILFDVWFGSLPSTVYFWTCTGTVFNT